MLRLWTGDHAQTAHTFTPTALVALRNPERVSSPPQTISAMGVIAFSDTARGGSDAASPAALLFHSQPTRNCARSACYASGDRNGRRRGKQTRNSPTRGRGSLASATAILKASRISARPARPFFDPPTTPVVLRDSGGYRQQIRSHAPNRGEGASEVG